MNDARRLPAPRFLVFSRDDCGLCEEFIAALAGVLAGRGVAFEVRDVDADPATQRRYGYKVPVLTCDGSVVCHGQLDAAALTRLLAG